MLRELLPATFPKGSHRPLRRWREAVRRPIAPPGPAPPRQKPASRLFGPSAAGIHFARRHLAEALAFPRKPRALGAVGSVPQLLEIHRRKVLPRLAPSRLGYPRSDFSRRGVAAGRTSPRSKIPPLSCLTKCGLRAEEPLQRPKKPKATDFKTDLQAIFLRLFRCT